MTKGMELEGRNEVQETPEKGAQEVGETRAEPLEAPEVIKRVEQATFEPEAVVEREGDFKQAEALKDAFVKAVEEPELPPVPEGLLPGSTELELPKAQEGQPALSDAPDIQPPTSGLSGLSEVGLEAVGDGFVPLGESESSISPGSSDQAGFLIGTAPTLEQALSVKPTVEAEIPEASVGEVRDVPIDPERIVTKPEPGEAPRTPVVGTAEQTMDLDAYTDTPELRKIEAVAKANEAVAIAVDAAGEVLKWGPIRDTMYSRYQFALNMFEGQYIKLINRIIQLNMILSMNGFPTISSPTGSDNYSFDISPLTSDPSFWPSQAVFEIFQDLKSGVGTSVHDYNDDLDFKNHQENNYLSAQNQYEEACSTAASAESAALEALTALMGEEEAREVLSEALTHAEAYSQSDLDGLTYDPPPNPFS